jgi:hypothetical protein
VWPALDFVFFASNQICAHPTLAAVSAYENHFVTGPKDPDWPGDVYVALGRVIKMDAKMKWDCPSHAGRGRNNDGKCSACSLAAGDQWINSFAQTAEVAARLDVMRGRTVRRIVQDAAK